jgi:hypothetical protein
MTLANNAEPLQPPVISPNEVIDLTAHDDAVALVQEDPATETQAEGGATETQAATLVALAACSELFHTGALEPFATVPVGRHHETYPLEGNEMEMWLGRQFWEEARRQPSAQAMKDAISRLVGVARYEGSETEVYVRIAPLGDGVVIDLGTPDWSVIRVDASGWEHLTESPVKFRRPRSTHPLPIPERGGALSDLRPFVNVGDDQWPLLLAFLVTCFRATGPYAVLNIHGPQGSSKTTVTRIIRALVDPRKAGARAAPRNEQDLAVGSLNSWLLAYDNLSSIRSWLSDALCRIVTGAGFGARALYTNADEHLIDVMRPVILNGIPELPSAPDLLDRSVMIRLESISDEIRRTERDFWREFDSAKPRIFGALLDALATAILRSPEVNVEHLPRMADFAHFAIAAEPAFGLGEGAFMKAYEANREEGRSVAIESSPIGRALMKLIAANKGEWEGSAGTLLEDLKFFAGEGTMRSRGWPQTPKGMRSALDRIQPSLLASGIAIQYGKTADRSHSRVIFIKRQEAAVLDPSETSEPSVPAAGVESDVSDGSDGAGADG